MTTINDYLDFIAEDTGQRPPTVWVICSRCGGDGTLGGWAGAYTESDRAEWSAEDYEDYVQTRRCCDECEGTGKLRTIDEDDPAYEGWLDWLREDADDRHTRWCEGGWAW